MALRAGYYGLKNSVKKKLENLAGEISGMKIIKTIGNGLKLTSSGTMSVDIDTDTMEFKTGKLAAKITSGYSKTVLFDGDYNSLAPTNTDVTILGDLNITDYDLLLFQITSSGEITNKGTWQYIASPEVATATHRNVISVFSDRLIFWDITGDKTFQYRGEGQQIPGIVKLYGIKL